MKKRFGNQGLEIVSIALDEDREAVRTMVAERDLDWTHICDQQGQAGLLPRAFNAQGFPIYYVIDRDGTLLAKKRPLAEMEEVVARAFDG